MLFKGSRHRVLSWCTVQRDLHCASLVCRNPPWSLRLKSTPPPIAYACTDYWSDILNVDHVSRSMPSQGAYPDTTPVIQNVDSLVNCQNRQMRGPLGNSELPPAKRRISLLAVERDSSQGWSSVASTIQSKNSTPSSSLNNSHIADITQRITSTSSATQRRSISTPTTMSGTSSRSTPAPIGTLTRRVVSSPASSIAITATPLSGLQKLPTTILNQEACTIITNPLRMLATEKNQRQSQWELQLHAVPTPRSMVSRSRSIQSIWSLRHDESCVCNRQSPGPLHEEQTAGYECKRLGGSKVMKRNAFQKH